MMDFNKNKGKTLGVLTTTKDTFYLQEKFYLLLVP